MEPNLKNPEELTDLTDLTNPIAVSLAEAGGGMEANLSLEDNLLVVTSQGGISTHSFELRRDPQENSVTLGSASAMDWDQLLVTTPEGRDQQFSITHGSYEAIRDAEEALQMERAMGGIQNPA